MKLSEAIRKGSKKIREVRNCYLFASDDTGIARGKKACGCPLGAAMVAVRPELMDAPSSHNGRVIHYVLEDFPWTARPASDFPGLVEALGVGPYEKDLSVTQAISRAHQSRGISRAKIAKIIEQYEPEEEPNVAV